MKIWSGLFNVFAVILIAIMLVVFNNIFQVNERQFEEIKLQYASDYAAMSAFRLGLDQAQSQNTNYTDLSTITISPEDINENYRSILEMSYNQTSNEYTNGLIEDSIVTAVICEPWGYRILETVEYDYDPYDTVIGGEYKNQWSYLRPYIVYSNGGSRLFAANICNQTTKEYAPQDYDERATDPETGGHIPTTPLLIERTTYEDTGLKEADVRVAIAQLLTEDLNNEVAKRVYSSAYGPIDSIYIPVSESLNAINSIKSTTLLLVIQHATIIKGKVSSTSYTLSGVTATPKTQVIGFDYNGMKYYCYAGQQVDPKTKILLNEGDGVKIEKTYETIEEAAKDGYYPHYLFLRNPKRPTSQTS